MGTHRWKDVQKRKLSQEQVEDVRRRVADEVLEMNLRSLRESQPVSPS